MTMTTTMMIGSLTHAGRMQKAGGIGVRRMTTITP